MAVGKKVRAAREARGLSQSRLEHDAGLPLTTVTQVERGGGNACVADLLAIARALGVPVRDLLPDGPDDDPPPAEDPPAAGTKHWQ